MSEKNLVLPVEGSKSLVEKEKRRVIEAIRDSGVKDLKALSLVLRELADEVYAGSVSLL